jgi:sulfite exporter TauE/SafE
VIETVIGKFIKIDTAGNKAATRFFNVFLTIRTFVIVTFIWILFRASSMEQVGIIFKSLLKNIDTGKHLQVDVKLWVFLGIFLIVDYLLFNTRFDSWIGQKKLPVRWTIYTAIIFLIIVFSSVNNFPFIYFQF